MMHVRQRGFTVIELMLAMTFLSFVLIFVSLAMVQMLRTYDKGVTIKQINQAGRTLTEDLTRSIRSANATTEVITNKIDLGVICVGNVAYVWNPVFRQDKTYQNLNRYTFNSGAGFPAETVSLARVYVANPTSPASVCQSSAATTFFFNKDADNYPLLSPKSRIVWAQGARSSDGKVFKLTFYLGSYDSTETTALQAGTLSSVYNTPYFANTLAATEPQCRDGSGGTFCFVSSFEATIYLPNAVN